MYGEIVEECGDVKKVMGERSSLLTVNGLCNILCEQARESNFKCKIGATHAHTGKYLWDEYFTTVQTNSDYNYTIIDTYYYKSEVQTYHNHNYVEILESGLQHAPDPSSTNEWKEFVGEPEFDEIAASATPAKHQKGIYAEQLIKV